LSNLHPCSVVSSVYKCGTNGRWCGCIAECTWMAFHRSAQWGPGNLPCPFKLNSLISSWDFTPKHPQCCLSHDLHDRQLKLSSLLFFYLWRMRWGLGSLYSFKVPKASEYLVAAVYALDQSVTLIVLGFTWSFFDLAITQDSEGLKHWHFLETLLATICRYWQVLCIMWLPVFQILPNLDIVNSSRLVLIL
jgi:hypothetical protein